jgi:hypothetical protein
MAMTRRTAGEYLLEKGLITQEQLEDARRVQQSTGKELIQIFLDQTLVSERDAYEAKAFELGMPFVDLDRVQPEPSAINVVKEHIAKRYNVIPVKKDGNILYLAMADPSNVMAIDDVRVNSRCTVRPVIAAPGAIEDAIRKAYGGSAADGATPATTDGGWRGSRATRRPARQRDDRHRRLQRARRHRRRRESRAARSRRGTHRARGEHHHQASHQRTRQRHPCGAPNPQPAHPLPHRRRAARSALPTEICASAAHLPLQNHGGDEHRRETPSARRTHSHPLPKQRLRPARVVHPDPAWRENRHAYPR